MLFFGFLVILSKKEISVKRSIPGIPGNSERKTNSWGWAGSLTRFSSCTIKSIYQHKPRRAFLLYAYIYSFLSNTAHTFSHWNHSQFHSSMSTYIYIYQSMNFKMQYVKHLSEITPKVSATAERGARFHPTVGVANPTGFTTSHPRAETTMLWDCVFLSASDQERRLQSFLSAITHSA